MPGFCVNCGAPILGAFCNNCGAKAIPPGTARQASPPIAPPPLPVQQPVSVQVQQPPPPVVPSKSSGAGKILLWIGCILLVLLLAGVGATMYGYYWVKHKVTSYASAITGGSSEPMKVVDKGDSCRLLPATELQQILGVAIEKSAEVVQGSDPGCAYYTNDASFAKLQHMAAEHAQRQVQEASKNPAPNGDNPLALLKNANQLEGVMKTLTMKDAGNGQVFSFTIERGFGSESWSGMRLMEAALPGFEDVSGVGDRAMMGAFGHAFYAMKGDVLIHMDTMMIPDARTHGVAIGKKIFSRM